jgi:nucleoside-diphosphate-sugar epimerase
VSRLVSSAAARLFASVVRPDDRVLVLGAAGWFGRTALDLLDETGAAVLALASRHRTIVVANTRWDIDTWSPQLVAEFDPTIIIDCAFLTREKTAMMPLADYVRINRMLTRQLLLSAASPSARIAVTISSGAAMHPVDALTSPLEENPYGYLKREAEQALLDLSGDRLHAMVARAWSVSGAHNQRPSDYAMGDMILQARHGKIRVKATREVWRRYITVDELLAVTLAAGVSGSGVLDSGGPLVEMQELSEAVRAAINPSASITREPLSGGADRYFSDDESWESAVHATGLVPLSLHDQILLTSAGIARPLSVDAG